MSGSSLAAPPICYENGMPVIPQPRYNPLRLGEKIKDEKERHLFFVASLAAYEFCGFDTRKARARILRAFRKHAHGKKPEPKCIVERLAAGA